MVHQVAAALIRRDDEILLVCQQGKDDAEPTWALPGGVVEPGEMLIDALTREVREETGLSAVRPGRLAYVVQTLTEQPDGVSQSIAYIFELRLDSAALNPADPDGLIQDAVFVARPKAIDKLGRLPWRNMREPALSFLLGLADYGATWCYRQGSDGKQKLIGKVCASPRL
jgi:8-oxo-dGTP diphosphatase